MKIVYIAGPYGDKGGYLSIDKNIAQARHAAAWCAKNGLGFICPHLNSAHFEAIVPDVPVEFWYEMDLHLMRAADAMLVLPYWEKSSGTIREIAHATEVGLPTFYWIDNYEGSELLLEWAGAS